MEIKLSDHFTYKKLLRFVLPSIVMMVFTSIYCVVDGLFVSNFVGKTPFAAINLIMPFVMIFGGVGFMFGTGGSALVSKTLGEKRPEKAKQYFTMMLLVTLIVGIIISVIGIIFMPQIADLLGAEGSEMKNDCVVYGRIVIGFNTAFMLQNVFQSFFVTAEKPKLGLAVTVAAGVTNMILDAVFMVPLNMGVAGAAIATGISQCVGGIIPLIYFLRPNSSLLQITKTKIEIKPVLRACGNGASELVTTVTSSIVGMLYNFRLLEYSGENGVATYGVLMYVEFIFIAIFIGYSVGCAPIIGYHYGAGNNSELNNMLKKSLKLIFGCGVGMVLLGQLLAIPLAHLFVGYDKVLYEETVNAFRIFALTFLFSGFNIFASSFFTALSDGGVSATISFLRTFLFKCTAVIVLPIIFGINGIWWATVVAEVLAIVLSAVFLIVKRKKYGYA